MLQMGRRLVAVIVLALLAWSTTLAVSLQIQVNEPQQENHRILDALRRNLSARDKAHQWHGRTYKHALTDILESTRTKKEDEVERGYSVENILDAFQHAKDSHYQTNGNGNGNVKKPTSPSSSKGSKHKTSKKPKGRGKKGGSKSSKSSKSSSIDLGTSGDKNYPAPIQTRRVPNVVLSYVLPAGNARTGNIPTYTDYAILAEVTVEWFEQAVRDQLVPKDMFLLTVDAKLDYTASDEGNPDPRFNAMIVYDYIEYTFYVTTNAASNAPSVAELDAAMRDSITAEYVLNAVRTVKAFSAADEVFYQMNGRPLPPSTPSISPPTSQPPPPNAFPTTPPPTGLEPFVPPGPFSDANNVVLIGPFYMAYAASDIIEPTQEQYDQQVAVTVDYFNSFIDQGLRAGGLSGVFYGSEAAIGSIGFGAGCPAERFNIFMEYESLSLYFAANDQADIELFSEALERLSVEGIQVLLDSITADFITGVIWSVDGAFSSVKEVVLGHSDECLP